jgi:PEP-CTERM motif
VLSNGTSGSSEFSLASLFSPSRSTAVVNIVDPEPIPEPLTILGSLAAGGVGIALRRKQKQQQELDQEV